MANPDEAKKVSSEKYRTYFLCFLLAEIYAGKSPIHDQQIISEPKPRCLCPRQWQSPQINHSKCIKSSVRRKKAKKWRSAFQAKHGE